MRKQEKTLTSAAAKAGMDEKTARKWLKNKVLPSQTVGERYWRTREDPFEEVWPQIEVILKRSPSVEGTTVFDYLCREHPGQFQEGQLRTLQRRMKRWRVEKGRPQEVMFAQRHRPGEQAQSDFTYMGRVGVTLGGQPFTHLLYHFVLSYSNWEWVKLCHSESLESLSEGLQQALWELGSVPREHRTDSLSSAVQKITHPEEFTERYRQLLEHYGMTATHTQAGRAHELGDAEQSHHRFKKAVEQELLLRGSRDFESRASYEGFLHGLVARRNQARQKRLKEELAVMRELPSRRVEDFTRQWVKVGPSSTIRVRNNVYSVDSRLIGERVEVRIHGDHLEVWYGQKLFDEMPRLRGEGKHRIEYRHIIHSLVRKPGAFRRYRYREDLFPRLLFRVAYDELCRCRGDRADREYLRILKLAADAGEQRVESALRHLIETGERIDAEQVERVLKAIEEPAQKWEITLEPIQLSHYDELLEVQL